MSMTETPERRAARKAVRRFNNHWTACPICRLTADGLDMCRTGDWLNQRANNAAALAILAELRQDNVTNVTSPTIDT